MNRLKTDRWRRPVVLVLSWILASSLCACRDRPVVNLGQVKTPHGADGSPRPRPELRVAVAARISPESTWDLYDALLDRVAEGVGRRAVFSQRRTYAEVNALVEGKMVDLAFVCSGPYAKGHDLFGMELLVAPVVEGRAAYYSYLVVGKDSPFQSLDDLRGRKFAFTDVDSNTGYLVPTFNLGKRNETPDTFFSETFFTHSHDASIRAVADGFADGAAVDSLVWDYLDAVDSPETAGTRIIDRSRPFGIPPVVVHPDLDDRMKEDLRETFLGLHEDPAAKEMLRVLRIDRFVRADDAAYDTVREMRQWMTNTGGKPD